MATLSVCGNQVTYTTTGDGPGLALLHGTTSGGVDGFGPAVARFAQDRAVITIDYAGCGASTLPGGELTLDLLVEQAAAAIRDAGSGPVDLLGFSLGAGVAAATAATYPDLVGRLVQVAGWATSEDPRHQMVFDTWSRIEALDPALGVRYGLSLAFSPRFLEALDRERFEQALGRAFPPGTRQRLEPGRRLDLRGALGMIVAPTLVVGLARDCLVPSSHALRLHALIPGSRYAEVDSGHAVFHENPVALVSLVHRFLLEDLF